MMEPTGDHSQKLYNMMKLSDDMSYDYTFAVNYIQRKDITNRNSVVNWMKYCVEHVLGTDCPSTRDTSIQIFDKFILFSSYNEPSILNNTRFLSYAAAASVVLGAKFTDAHSQLTLARLTECDFDMDRLIEFEHNVLALTGCNISTLCTPSSFLHHIMELTGGVERKDTVLMNADLLIAEFWGEPVSLLYAPSTIAITALLLSFSLLKIPCHTLLNALPLYCFLSPANPFFECEEGIGPDGRPLSPTARFLDHERCIAEFQKMEVMRKYQRSASPALTQSSSSCSGSSTNTVSPATSSVSLSTTSSAQSPTQTPTTPPSSSSSAHTVATVTPSTRGAKGRGRGGREGEGEAGLARAGSPMSVTTRSRRSSARREQVREQEEGAVAGTDAQGSSSSACSSASSSSASASVGAANEGSPPKRVRRE